jgi:hypothetical protein
MNLAYRPPSLPHRLGCHGDGVVIIIVNVRNCVACLADPERSKMSVDRRVQQKVRLVQGQISTFFPFFFFSPENTSKNSKNQVPKTVLRSL